MSESSLTSNHERTSIRRKGVRLLPEERKEAQEVFLANFRENANVRLSCLIAGIDRHTVYKWIKNDEAFAEEYKQAELDANDTIRAELFRRAVLGYEKPVVSMGKIVYVEEEINGEKVRKPLMERVYSDMLMALLAKARMPEFREKTNITITTLPKEYAFDPDTVEGSIE